MSIPFADEQLSASRQQGRVPMPEQDPKVRARNFLEVPLGYTAEMAQMEAGRCLQCKKPACVAGCPVNVNIPGFLKLLKDGAFAAAAQKIKENNPLPAVCGRVCPQERQCESRCILGKKSESVAVGRCERFVADFEHAALERERRLAPIPASAFQTFRYGGKSCSGATNGGVDAIHQFSIGSKMPQNGKRIAVVGSGPAGLTVAGDMILLGYDVTIFEAFHKPGGVLMYGIPEFRLPKSIVENEVDYLCQLGVKIELNKVIGKIITIDELLSSEGLHGGFNAVFVGVGAGLPLFLNLPGEDRGGIYSASEYLTRSNLMKAYQFPEYDTPVVRGKHVCVIGGGNVSMDAARTALRLGADSVKIVYRRSRDELPARREEIHHAEEEGVEFLFLTRPKEYLGNDAGQVRAMICEQMELGEPDASGRRSPRVIANSDLELTTDCVIVATGTLANPLLTHTTPGLERNERGYIVADEKTGRTSKPGVWAGGDIVTGSATVILAMGAGRMAAQDMHAHFFG